MTKETIKEILESSRDKQEVEEAFKSKNAKVSLLESEGSLFVEEDGSEELNENLQFLRG